MRLSTLPIAIAAGAVAAAPQAAQAAVTLTTPLAPCYRSVDAVEREPVQIAAGGFTPGADVEVMLDGVVEVTVSSDEQGRVIGSLDAPYQRRGERDFMLTLAEKGNADNTLSATSRVTALALRLKPRRAPLSICAAASCARPSASGRRAATAGASPSASGSSGSSARSSAAGRSRSTTRPTTRPTP